MRRIKVLFLLALWFGMIATNALADTQITFTFAGDCTLGSEERMRWRDDGFSTYAETKGYAYFFEQVQPLFAEDDLTVVNLEGVLKDTPWGALNKTYCFRGDPAYTDILRLGSVEAVSLANNHTSDFGYAGRRTTIQALDAAGIHWFNDTDFFVYEKDGVKVAFFGLWRSRYYSLRDALREQIATLRAQGVQAVVAMLHFGQEYSPIHGKAQTTMSRELIDAGVDLVIGSHPHVVQGMEVYQNRTILYSLGNFVFGGNASVRALESLVAQVSLQFDAEGRYAGQTLRLYAAQVSGDAAVNDYQPRLVDGEAADAVFALLDQDSVGQPAPLSQLKGVREYAFLPAQAEPN